MPATVNPSTEPWHATSAAASLQRIGTDASLGLPAAEVTRRQARHGRNVLP